VKSQGVGWVRTCDEAPGAWIYVTGLSAKYLGLRPWRRS
jgi:hypothetical protein